MSIRASHGVARAAGLLLGFSADRFLGDPARWHPVAGFGRGAAALERRTYRTNRAAGIVHTAILVGAVAAAGAVVERYACRARWPAVTVSTAAATWVALGGTSLARTGRDMAAHLERDDIDAARQLLSALCGRDPGVLNSAGLARAALESVAENTSDAAVGVLFWGALAGVPGVLGYRAINTLDAMIGYRSTRYARFGWAAARTDDVVNYLPARLTGALTVLSAPMVGGSRGRALAAWRADAAKHPSPNAGVAEAAAAGALDVQLGGRTEYPYGVESRPTLGQGGTPTVADLRRGVRLSAVVQAAAAVTSAVLAVAVGELRLPNRGLRLRRRNRR